MRITTLLVAGLALMGCRDKGTETGLDDTGPSPDDTAPPTDADGDGYAAGDDCNDYDAGVNPGADEICGDGIDNDCDDLVDADDDSATGAATWYADSDSDGYGDAGSTIEACSQPSGYSDDASDCDDADKAINPGADEVCDGVDNDCDDTADEDAVDASTWYTDGDADGYGDEASGVAACDQPKDTIGDGGDCDDADKSVSPAAEEICDGIDNDCSGVADDAATDAATWYADGDADGYGLEKETTEACDQPSGYSGASGDCDDGNKAISPAAEEVCDDTDNDCDGDVDGGATDAGTWYADTDSDSYGDAGNTVDACDAPTGYGSDATDCDDGDAAINPAAEEVCDGADNDCDGSVDNGTDGLSTWYADGDSDGYGDDATTADACDQPSGYVADGGDCDDADGAINPDADEVCDDADNNCDGTTDDDAIDQSTWYADSDSDGYGDDADGGSTACDAPTGTVGNNSDCDDSDGAINPDAAEVCDDADNDCDGDVDGGASDASTWYADSDSDSYGDPDTTTTDCDQPSGYLADDSDCDDDDSAVNPDGTEVCDDGADNDCDGTNNGCELSGALGIEGNSDVQIRGSQNNAKTGHAVRAADLDGDGQDDVASAGFGWDLSSSADNGAVWVFNGPLTAGEYDMFDSDAGFYAGTSLDYAGYGIDIGDIDGDSSGELIIGAYGDDTADGGAGAVYVVDGTSSTDQLDVVAEAVVTGEAASDNLGVSVAYLGDVNGDGVGDLGAGAWKNDNSASNGGAGYLFFGPVTGSLSASDADGVWDGTTDDANLGWSVAALGDLDDDGYDDVAVSAIDDGGAGTAEVWVLYGAASTGGMDAYSISGTSGGRLGYVLGWTGDVTGDGLPDIGVGEPDSGGGMAYVIEGPIASDADVAAGDYHASFSGTGRAGYSVAGIGDLNNDGVGDLAIGGTTYSSSAGAVWIFYGPIEAGDYDLDADADIRLQGTDSNDLVGVSISSGDVNGDGIGDVLIGAQGDESNGTGTGTTYIVFGTGY